MTQQARSTYTENMTMAAINMDGRTQRIRPSHPRGSLRAGRWRISRNALARAPGRRHESHVGLEAIATRNAAVDVPESRIHEASSGLVPRRHALTLNFPLITERALDDCDERRSWVRVPSQRAIRRNAEVLDKQSRLVLLDRSREPRDVEIRRIDMRCKQAGRHRCRINYGCMRSACARHAQSQYENGDTQKDQPKSHCLPPSRTP